MVSVDTSSAVIQALVLVLCKTDNNDECKKLCEHVFDNVFKGKSLLIRNLDMPFGGCKESGTGREGVYHSLESYTDLKTCCLKINYH